VKVTVTVQLTIDPNDENASDILSELDIDIRQLFKMSMGHNMLLKFTSAEITGYKYSMEEEKHDRER